MKTFYLRARLAITFIFTIIYFTAKATNYPINVTFSGLQEVPSNGSPGTGTFVGTYDDVTDSLIYTITFSGLTANVTAAHFHGYVPPGIAGPILIGPAGFPTGVMSGSFTDTLVLTSGQEDSLKMGLIYFNIHTSAFPGGEIRAQIFLQSAGFSVPVITCPADTSVNAAPGLCSDTLDFTSTVVADTPTAVVHYRIGNTAITLPYGFPGGTTTVVATALNAAGYDTCTFNVTVNDIEPPVVTCPSDVVQSNDPGECGAIVTFPDAIATDNCPGVTVTYSDTSGSFFPVGTTTVTVTATDGAGNTATCSFTITVNDTEPPVIEGLSADPDMLWPPNHKMKDVAIDYTSTDNCPGVITCSITVTSNQPVNGTGDGNTEPDWEVIDEHNVKLRAERAGNLGCRIYSVKITCTDQFGNSSDSTVKVVVPHDMSGRDQCVDTSGGGGGRDNGGRLTGPRRALNLSALTNPSRTTFTFDIRSLNNNERVTVRIIDMLGRVVESRTDIQPNQLIQMGGTLRGGVYIVELRQGDEVQQIRILKLD